jgi:hypothetical protein
MNCCGFSQESSGKKSITYPEASMKRFALLIDGVRNSLDETSYTIRFTPRRPKSIWSSTTSGMSSA